MSLVLMKTPKDRTAVTTGRCWRKSRWACAMYSTKWYFRKSSKFVKQRCRKKKRVSVWLASQAWWKLFLSRLTLRSNLISLRTLSHFACLICIQFQPLSFRQTEMLSTFVNAYEVPRIAVNLLQESGNLRILTHYRSLFINIYHHNS